MLIEIVDHIDINRAYEHLQSPAAGGINIFVGTVRDQANGKEVEKLVFEGYEPMALFQMEKIATRASDQWDLNNLVMIHALGEKKIGEPVVIVGAASSHRLAAFEACRFLIDELKATVPIWKKEYYTDSSIWVNAHP